MVKTYVNLNGEVGKANCQGQSRKNAGFNSKVCINLKLLLLEEKLKFVLPLMNKSVCRTSSRACGSEGVIMLQLKVDRKLI